MADVKKDESGKIIRKDDDSEGGGGAPPIRSSDDDIIPVRRSSLHDQQGYAMRKKAEADALKNKGAADTGAPDGEDDDEGDELTPEARKGIEREVQRHVEPLRKALFEKADEDELAELFEDYPEAKEKEPLIRKYMGAHPTATPEMIYHHIAFRDATKTVARKRDAADLDAALHKGSGRSRRLPANAGENDDIPDVKDMSDKDFEELENKVKQGKFKPAKSDEEE